MADISKIDANLLVLFHTVLVERNITRAAVALNTTPSAVSAGLKRLRQQLGDPLLVRDGRSFRLTDFAVRIRPVVEGAVAEAERTFNLRREFNPATSDRRFLISASDYAMAVLAEPLFELFEKEAPSVSVAFEALPVTEAGFESVLLRRDVVIASDDRGIPGRRRALFEDELVVVAHRDNPALTAGAMSDVVLSTVPFAIPTFGSRLGHADEMFARAGFSPRVAVRVGGYGPVPWIIRSGDLVSVIPRRTLVRYASSLGLIEVRTSLEPVAIIETAFWNPAFTDDQGVMWLLAALQRLRPARHSENV